VIYITVAGLQDMYLLGQLEHGRYADCSSHEHNDPDEDAEADEDIVHRVERQLNHNAIDVPRIQNPFVGREAIMLAFWEGLAEASAENILPSGYGFLPDEDGYGEWIEVESVAVGRRRRGKRWKVTLPRRIWEPRAKAWVQAAEALALMC
jgi:hypothetical protein